MTPQEVDAIRARAANISTRGFYSDADAEQAFRDREALLDALDAAAQQERDRLRNKAFPGRNVAQKFASVDRAFFDDPDEADR